ncbi:MAG: hypothetical protein EBX50_09590 [Chitinophagia bacterium]|nr:hypothetical protein [Chitinophagia bacterium]
MIVPNVHCQWHPLQEVWVGSTYSSEYYRDIPNSKVRDFFQKMAEETVEDLNGFAKVCEQYGAVVHRPKLDPRDSLMSHVSDRDQIGDSHRPPMQVRDAQIVANGKLYIGDNDHPAIRQLAKDTISDELIVDCFELNRENPLYLDRSIKLLDGYGAATVLKFGKEILVSAEQPFDFIPQFTRNIFGDGYDVIPISTNGHLDSKVSILNPNFLVYSWKVSKHFENFNGTKVILDKNIIQTVMGYSDISTKYKGKYWVKEAENNPDLSNWIDDYVIHWTNESSVTFFDLNLLSLDEKTIVVASYNKDIYEQAKKHGIEVIHSPLRHRFFWDCGIHCCTLDIKRKGDLETYNLKGKGVC